MKVVKCSFPSLERVGGKYKAKLFRLSEHPILGPPSAHKLTITSAIRQIDFERGYMITQNTLYYWEGTIQ